MAGHRRLTVVLGCLAMTGVEGVGLASEVREVDGVRLIHVPDMDAGLVWVQVLFEAGALRDPPGKEGLAHLTARMLLRGTKTRTYQQVVDEVADLGAELDATAQKEVIGLYGDFMPRFGERYAAILADILAHPTFPEREFEQERGLVIEDLLNLRNDDAELARHFFSRFLYRDHPLGRPSMGYLDTVKKLTAEDCRSFYREHARRGNLIVVLAGAMDEAGARRFARRLARGLRAGREERVPLPPPPKVEGLRVLIVDKPERSQTQVILGHPSLGWNDADLFPVLVGNTAFGGTFTSRLMREIREKRGWSYGVSSQVVAGREFGTLAIRFFPASRDTVAAIRVALDMVREVARAGLTEPEVSFARNHLSNQFPFRIETVRRRAEEALANLLYGRPADFLETFVERVRAQTVEAVNAAMGRWYRPDDMVIVVVGTASDIERDLRALPGVREVIVHPFDQDRL